MVDGLFSKEIKAIDDFTIRDIGIPSMVLMERAALAVSQFIMENTHEETVYIFCGPGNNGGDGIAVGRILSQKGRKVYIYPIGDFSKATKETLMQLTIAKNMNVSISEKKFIKEIEKESVVVDAIFGIGLNRKVDEPYLSVIQTINDSDATKVSLDVPSGLSSDKGECFNEGIKADFTASIGFWKIGFNHPKAEHYTGKISVLDIGYPSKDFFAHIIEKERHINESI